MAAVFNSQTHVTTTSLDGAWGGAACSHRLLSVRELVPLHSTLVSVDLARAFGIAGPELSEEPCLPTEPQNGRQQEAGTSQQAAQQHADGWPHKRPRLEEGAASMQAGPSTACATNSHLAITEQQRQQQLQSITQRPPPAARAPPSSYQSSYQHASMQQLGQMPGLGASMMQQLQNAYGSQQYQYNPPQAAALMNPYYGRDPNAPMSAMTGSYGYPPMMYPGAVDYTQLHRPAEDADAAAMAAAAARAAAGTGADGNNEEEYAEDMQARALKRTRLVWTPQLHKCFEEAVHKLGVDKAVPKTIMQLMKVDGLTRENVASHLQKYRLSLKKQGGLQAETEGATRDGGTDAAAESLQLDRGDGASGQPPNNKDSDKDNGGSGDDDGTGNGSGRGSGGGSGGGSGNGSGDGGSGGSGDGSGNGGGGDGGGRGGGGNNGSGETTAQGADGSDEPRQCRGTSSDDKGEGTGDSQA